MGSLLDNEHHARTVWEYVEHADLSELHAPIRSVKGPAIDPRVLLAVWLYATPNGVGSAHTLDEFCRNHIAYRRQRAANERREHVAETLR